MCNYRNRSKQLSRCLLSETGNGCQSSVKVSGIAKVEWVRVVPLIRDKKDLNTADQARNIYILRFRHAASTAEYAVLIGHPADYVLQTVLSSPLSVGILH